MVQVNLRKLISKKDTAFIISNLISETDTPLVIKDTDGKPIMSFNGEYLICEDTKNIISDKNYPIKVAGEAIGWVTGGKGASSLATLLAYLADNESEKKMLVEDTLDKYRELSLLYDIADRISVCLELNDVARLVIHEATRLVQATNASVMLLKENRFEIISAYGMEYTPKTILKPGEGIAGSVFVTGKAEIVNDVMSDPRFINGNNKIGSLICAPLKVKDKVIGILNISNTLLMPYKSDDLKLISILASQAASAIENAILHENKLKEDRIKTHLKRYIAPQIVKTIMDTKEGIALNPARKKVSILFSDIRNFSSICEKLIPEETVMYLNEYFAHMVEIIFSYNGTVNKFVGDMIVALFGAPANYDKNEEHAVRTAISMQKRIKKIKINWIRDNFHTGIGISTGEVVVGNIGSPQHMDYTAIGDEVNIAERLQSIAKGGQILVDRSTYEFTKRIFEFRELGGTVVKGKKRLVEIFEVLY